MLRFLLAVFVIVSHAYPITIGPEGNDSEPLSQLTGHTTTLGELAVCGFFAISGFLITNSLVRSSGWRNYLWKRVLRIYPAFLAASMVTFCIIVLTGGAEMLQPKQAISYFVRMFLLVTPESGNSFGPNPFPHAANGSMWSIRYEFACYVAVMVLLMVAASKRQRAAFGLLVAVTGCNVARLISGISLPEFWMPTHIDLDRLLGVLPYYFAGATFYGYRDTLPQKSWLAAIASGFLCVSFFVPIGQLGREVAVAVVVPLAFCYLLLWLAYQQKIKLHHFGKCGDFSYGIYLYAFPIQQLLVYHRLATTPLSNFAAALPLSIVAGVLSWHLVEKHFMRLKKLSVQTEVKFAAEGQMHPVRRLRPAVVVPDDCGQKVGR